MPGKAVPGLAAKLDHLFTTVPAPTRRGVYSNDSAAAVLEERGVAVTGVHLSHLRSGRRENPSAQLLAALADLFGVPLAYFFDPAKEEQINAELAALTAFRDERAKNLMLRAHGLSRQSIESVEAILERLRQLEGLDAAEVEQE